MVWIFRFAGKFALGAVGFIALVVLVTWINNQRQNISAQPSRRRSVTLR